MVDKDMELIEN